MYDHEKYWAEMSRAIKENTPTFGDILNQYAEVESLPPRERFLYRLLEKIGFDTVYGSKNSELGRFHERVHELARMRDDIFKDDLDPDIFDPFKDLKKP